MAEYKTRQRVRLWGLLSLTLVGAIAILLTAIGPKGTPKTAPVAVRLQVLDEAGVPLPNAVAFVRRKDGAPATDAKWDPDSATLGLSAADRGARCVFGAPGCRVARIESARENRKVVLERGYIVRLRITGDAPPLDAPLVGLLRVRPSDETASLGEGEGTRPLDLSELMQKLYRNRDDEMNLPTEKFGFAISENDAAAGFLVPTPGTYEIVWGMLDERPGTWFRLDDGPQVTIEVKDTSEPQNFDIEVSRPVWNRTRQGLKQRIQDLAADGSGS